MSGCGRPEGTSPQRNADRDARRMWQGRVLKGMRIRSACGDGLSSSPGFSPLIAQALACTATAPSPEGSGVASKFVRPTGQAPSSVAWRNGLQRANSAMLASTYSRSCAT